MSNGFHAAEDGSLARSTGGAAARGAMLIALAIVIGLLLLTFALNDQETEVAVTDDDTEEVDTEGDGIETDETDTEAGVEAVDPSTDEETADTTDGDTTDADAEAESIPEDPIETGARPASEVNVLVANGIGTSGIAGAAADTLRASGYIGVAADAPNTAASVIYYREGFDADARAVATVLGSTPDIIQPVPADGSVPINQNAIDDGRAGEANVVVIIGTDGAIPTS